MYLALLLDPSIYLFAEEKRIAALIFGIVYIKEFYIVLHLKLEPVLVNCSNSGSVYGQEDRLCCAHVWKYYLTGESNTMEKVIKPKRGFNDTKKYLRKERKKESIWCRHEDLGFNKNFLEV